MSRHRNQWSDPEVVLSFPKPPRFMFRPPEDWVRIVVEADWLFRHGWDTVDIAEHLRMHERDALRAVVQGREARRAAPSARPVHLVSYPVDVEDDRWA